MSRIRVLVVDDSVVIRKVVGETLAEQPDLEVVGVAANGQIALARMAQLNPDLVILDIEMPEMDGLSALAKMRVSHPKTQVVMFSSLTERGAKETLEALALGASDYFPKPSASLEESRQVIREQLVPSIRELCRSKIARPTTSSQPGCSISPTAPKQGAVGLTTRVVPPARVEVLAIGASTGGPNALAEVFAALPGDFPVPILVAQHMPAVFTRLLAERLSKQSKIPTVEAVTGDELTPGKAWIAPGDFHLMAVKVGTRIRTRLNQEPRENSCRPSVDPLFRSVASIYGPSCLALVLTGMGQDGLRGCEVIAAAGGQILVQDEATSVVWGMPGHVARAGLADKVLPVSMIGPEVARRAGFGRV